MTNRIEQAITKLFDKHRIIFWYDAKQELKEEFDSLEIQFVEKIEIDNNEFGLKHRVLREQPKDKFLLYKDGPEPAHIDNWLLDIQLANTEFRTDQVSIWLSEMELSLEFSNIVTDHLAFFQAVKRRSSIKRLLNSDDTSRQIRLKMLAVCANSDTRIDSILENLLQELADGKEDKLKLIERANLSDFLWERLEQNYGYQSEEPGVRDFVIELFKSCYATGLEEEKTLADGALVFLQRWKDSRKYAGSFEALSSECADVLAVRDDLAKRDFRALIELDYFRVIDQQIISDLVSSVANSTVSSGDVAIWVRRRRQCHWYKDYKDLYEAIDFAARFTQALEEAKLEMSSLTDGVERYTTHWYRIDQFYRKFTYHMLKSGEVSLLSTLADKVENLYTTNFLLKVSDQFQEYVDSADKWSINTEQLQRNFFDRKVKYFLRKEQRICVIISDAMRYEIGDELVSQIRKEDRYSAELSPAISMLPSYTQLGMAALLPNKTLEFADKEDGTVLVDGQSSKGKQNRIKILQKNIGDASTAVTAEEFLGMDRDQGRELLKANSVLYVYHNRIDHTGDKIHSEGQAFEAAEKAQEDILRLIKKLTAANATNILVTADHGFIYQNRPIAESDFADIDINGEKIHYKDRRFVLGRGLKASKSLHKFDSASLGLTGEMEVQLPKSINRLRLSGSGSRFVHGGATLQEIVIPVISINKKRQSDVTSVEVDILKGSSTVITSGQLTVKFYQMTAATDKVQQRVLRAGIYTEAGVLISDSHELIFDLASDNPREREFQTQFILTKEADEANGQEVILKLEEKHAGTSHFKEYKSVRYVVRRSFSSDFDF